MNAQTRMYRLGVTQRIAHNLARYRSGQVKGICIHEYIQECYEVMSSEEFKIPQTIQNRIIKKAKQLMIGDLLAIYQSRELSSSGGSMVSAYALLSEPLSKLSAALQN